MIYCPIVVLTLLACLRSISCAECLGNSTEIDNGSAKAHGCLMAFCWMFCAPTGIFLARHFRFLFPNGSLKMPLWLHIHRILMVFVPICSLTAFIVILYDTKWSWTSTSDLTKAHSAFGIVAISFSVLQACGAVYRPDHDQRIIRPVFNWVHRIFGIFTFLMAVIALWLGVFIDRMSLGNSGWGILLGWTVWIVFLIVVFETFYLVLFIFKKRGDNSSGQKYSKESSDALENQTNRVTEILEITKIALLFVHIFIALSFAVALVIVIGKSTIYSC